MQFQKSGMGQDNTNHMNKKADHMIQEVDHMILEVDYMTRKVDHMIVRVDHLVMRKFSGSAPGNPSDLQTTVASLMVQ